MWQIPMCLSGFKVAERVEVNKERDGFERPSETVRDNLVHKITGTS